MINIDSLIRVLLFSIELVTGSVRSHNIPAVYGRRRKKYSPSSHHYVEDLILIVYHLGQDYGLYDTPLWKI